MVNLFPKSMKKQVRSKLESVTMRGFGGGLNAVDDDISMEPRFSKSLKNFYRTSSGGQRLRFGNNWFCDIEAYVNSEILDMRYFNNRILAVTVNGYVVSISDASNVSIIWSPPIATLLPGAPGFWSDELTLVTFVPFKNRMIIHNGVDKPINIDSGFAVTYLQDEGTGSNVNAPIGKYGCIAANYHCIAGFENSPTEIVISSRGTAGTFPLDPAPNDAISIDVGAYAPEGAASIRGIAGYRSYLIVFLQGISLQVKLGIYDNSDPPRHTPEFPDTFPTFGLVGSRCITPVSDDLDFAGVQGLVSARRNLYNAGQLDGDMLSSIVEPLYQNVIGNLSDEDKQLKTFTVYDQLGHNLMLFEPNGNVFVYSSNDKLKYKSWSEYTGMDWSCGCTSFLGRVFLAKGTKIFQHGNDTFGERYYADRQSDRDTTWSTSTVFEKGTKAWDQQEQSSFVCSVSHTSRSTGIFSTDRLSNPTFWEEYKGEPINFEMELPWIDGKDPMKVKQLRFLSIASKGTAEFTLEAYVDNLYKDFEGKIIQGPAVTMTFIGNDAPGFGEELSDGPFGTGRRSRDPRLFNYPVKFKMIKFRIYGSALKPLEIINLSFLFARGLYFR